MKTFAQFILSNTHNYLYHGTTADKAADILKSDKIIGKPHHGFRKVRVSWNAVFFSRSHIKAFNFVSWFRSEKHPVVLVFDKNKLSNHYRISPVTNVLDRSRADSNNDLAEEYVDGDITNVSRYLVRIDIGHQQTWEMINREKSRWNILKKYVNLNKIPTNEERNV